MITTAEDANIITTTRQAALRKRPFSNEEAFCSPRSPTRRFVDAVVMSSSLDANERTVLSDFDYLTVNSLFEMIRGVNALFHRRRGLRGIV